MRSLFFLGLVGTVGCSGGVFESPQPASAALRPIVSRSPDGLWEECDRAKFCLQSERLNFLAGEVQEVDLPMPDGTYTSFQMERAQVFEVELARRFPEIQTFRGVSAEGERMSLVSTPEGMNAFIFGKDGAISSIIPVSHEEGHPTEYVSQAMQSMPDTGDIFPCHAAELVSDVEDVPSQVEGETPGLIFMPRFNVPVRTYRLAVATSNKFANNPQLGGGTLQGNLAYLANMVNALNVFYRHEAAIDFVLVNGSDKLFSLKEVGPFDEWNPSTSIRAAPEYFHSRLGNSNFDLGHVFLDAYLGGGGVAFPNSACEDAFKAGGASAMSSNANEQLWNLKGFVHEIGHQLGAGHSFNASCGGNRTSASAYEPGSGSTVMSYVNGCWSDKTTSLPVMRLHAGSLAEIRAFTSRAACGSVSYMGNSAPSVSAGPDRFIPRNTPFALSAVGLDQEAYQQAQTLLYSWDQIDSGDEFFANPPYTDANDPANTTRPLFRSNASSADSSRVFPSLEWILHAGNQPPEFINGYRTAEALPRIGRTLNFAVTVRDGFYGLATDAVRLTVAGTSGPFEVTAPNTAVRWTAGSTQAVQWSVANTHLAPVNCRTVRILLSTNGGLTFPLVLSAGEANDGIAWVRLPSDIVSDQARIKIEAEDNIFFDISNQNFAITR